MNSAKERADTLKEEGNKLFGKNEWQGAYDKYTSAIELDGNNTFYFMNRAATLMEMKRLVPRTSSSSILR
jgi:lipoprotein NlpI